MIRLLKNKLRGARTRLFGLLQPREPSVRTVAYRGVYISAPVHTDAGWRLYRQKAYEDAEIACIERYVRDDDVVFDIGANIGIYSLLLARRAREGKVVAVEPVPLNRAFLNLNLLLNSISNVEVLDGIVSDQEGQVDFSISEDELYSSLIPTGRKPTREIVRVPSRTLDALCDGGKVDVMKVDVEGAELRVLKGGERLFSEPVRRPRALLIELNAENQAAYGYSPDDVVRHMDDLGYGVFSLMNSGLIEGYIRDPDHEDVLFLDLDRVEKNLVPLSRA